MEFADNNGCAIACESRGDGVPLLMVMGLGGSSRGWWDEFPALLQRHCRLVLFDNRGTGDSAKPEAPWTMEDMASDVLAVADHFGLDRFHLLGCSLGSMIVRQFVGIYGGARLLSLSLFCPPNGIQATAEDAAAAIMWDRTKPALENARKSWPIVHPDAWIADNEDLLLAKFEENLQNPTPPRTFQFQLEAARSAPDANDALNGFEWPVLILHGTADRLVPPENARTLAAAVPRARMELLEGDGHMPWAHDPDRTARVLLDFLAAADARIAAPA